MSGSEERLDIVATWPKTRPLESYLTELEKAAREDLTICYRVARPPSWDDSVFFYGARRPRCYMVHDGAVRGYCKVVGCAFLDEDEAPLAVAGDADWGSGDYIIRNPRWHPIDPIPMRGFQGWRYFDEAIERAATAIMASLDEDPSWEV